MNHSIKEREQTRNSPSLKTLKATSSTALPPTRPYLLTSTQILSPTENQTFKGPRYQRHFSFKTLQHKKIRLENIIFINFLEVKKNIFFSLSKTLIAFPGHHLSLGGMYHQFREHRHKDKHSQRRELSLSNRHPRHEAQILHISTKNCSAQLHSFSHAVSPLCVWAYEKLDSSITL